MSDFLGMRIIESKVIPPKAPNVQLKPGLCSDDFERSMNAWLRDFFGESPVVFMIDPDYLRVGMDLFGNFGAAITAGANHAMVGNSLTIAAGPGCLRNAIDAARKG